jgi:hypothetical protein
VTSKDDKDRLKRAKEDQEARMMKFDVQPAKNRREKNVIDKAGKRFDADKKDQN